jgi:hypothetical protein
MSLTVLNIRSLAPMIAAAFMPATTNARANGSMATTACDSADRGTGAYLAPPGAWSSRKTARVRVDKLNMPTLAALDWLHHCRQSDSRVTEAFSRLELINLN